MKLKKAFTLIELLVVIAIIGLLATLSVLALNNARVKSRDTKRINDTKEIHTALELFFIDNGRFPTIDEWNSGQLASTANGSSTIFMETIPVPPTPNDGDCTASQNDFDYNQTEEGKSYTLSFCLGHATGASQEGLKCLTPGSLLDADCAPERFIQVVGTTNNQFANAIKQTTDGGYIVAGYSSNNGDDFYIARLDAEGNLVPTFGTNGVKIIGDSYIQRAWAVDQTTDGGFIVGGYTNTNGGYDNYVVRLDQDGNLVSSFGVGGEFILAISETQAVYSLKALADGTFILAGQTGTNGSDLHVFKLSANGALVGSFGSGGITNSGDAGYQQAYGVDQTDDGGFIVVGRTDANGGDMYLVRLDQNGALVPAFGTGGTLSIGGSGLQTAYAVDWIDETGFIVAGQTDVDGNDIYITRLDANGAPVTSFGTNGIVSMGGSGSQTARAVKQTLSGGFIIAGKTDVNGGDAYLVRLDKDGNLIPSFGDGGVRIFGDANNQTTISVQETIDGGIVAAGQTVGDGIDLYVVKMNSLGEYE